jgi:FkbM family methyltransferase
MTTQNLNPNPQFTWRVLKEKGTEMGDFTLLDVGCSGGIHELFRQFGDHLHAVGFDPLVPEIEKLTRENKNPNIRYEEGFVGSPRYAELFPDAERAKAPNNDFTSRTSSLRAQKGSTEAYQQEHFNSGQALKFSERKIALDDYCRDNKIAKVDFLKIDTDGHDYNVLLSAEELLGAGVLGASVEAVFHGPAHPHSNVFANIDRFMREKGFTLCDLDMFRYARGALPLPFYYDIPAQTRGGAPLWGEAVYFRDLADPNYEAKWGMKFTARDKIVLACLYDLFGLPDCAAELVLKSPDAFDPGTSKDYLNLLVPPMVTGRLVYDEYVGVFDMHPELWYPKNKLFGRG